MYVYMYVCMNECMYVCVYMCVRACSYVRLVITMFGYNITLIFEDVCV